MAFGTLILLALASFVAGFMGAVGGGGGLISMSALLLGLPASTPFATILGTNKVLAFTGTTLAAGRFLHSGIVGWREMVGPVAAAMAGACGGVAFAYFMQGRFDPFLRPLMLVLMLVMMAFTVFRPKLGNLHAPKFAAANQRGMACLIALGMGFYDGFFGPGTGAVLIFLFVAILGFDFLRSSAMAKSVHWASNLAAMAIFLWNGSWLPTVALTMAAANGAGGYLGAHMALGKGSGWVRVIFIVVVGALILQLSWQVLR